MGQVAKAASVLLVRGSDIPEYFVIRRADKLRFFGGFHAFPGGKVSGSDRSISVSGQLGDDVASERIVAAARELFEETGVLVGRRTDGAFPSSGSVLDYVRRKLLAEELTFAQVLERLELAVHASDFVPAGTAITPEFAPARFDTIFFLVRLPEGQQAEVWQGELETGVWASAHDTIEHWRQGEWLVTPPTIGILNGLAQQPVAAAAENVRRILAAAHSAPIPPIFFSPLVQMIPLKTVALPPGTHTNAYLVGGEKAYLIDPGTGLAEEQELLFSVLDQQIDKGRKLIGIILSHQHPDHVDGANACAQRYKLPIYGHPLTAQKLQSKGIRIDHELNDGDRLDLGTAPDGTGSSWYLQAVHTPGHAAGHLAFYEPRYRLLFAGDMVSTLSSVVIAPPEGDLAIYLASLRRLQTFDCRLLLPAHGNPTACPQTVIAESIAHRIRREEQLVAALGQSPRSVADLAQELYKGLVPQLMRFAELQVLAGLTKLKGEQRVAMTAEGPDALWKLV